MSTKTKATRRVCQHNRANVHCYGDNRIVSDYERGALIAGIIIAVSFGLMMLHWAVM